MRRLLLFAILFILASQSMMSQDIPDIDAVMLFLGVDDPGDADEEEVEKLMTMLEDPLILNRASAAALRSCGLFTPYQTAVIEDYRSRHGDILSLYELSLLDGFNDAYVRKLTPFISLQSKVTSDKDELSVRHELAVRSGYRWKEADGSDGSYGLKYRLSSSRYSLVTALSRAAGNQSWYPSDISVSFAWKFHKREGQLMLGDFNAMFGQGLTLWNGMFMTSLTTPDTFMKRPTGLSQPWSFTGSTALTGLAGDFRVGPFVISGMMAVSGMSMLMPAMNLAWYGRFGQVSLTNVMQCDMKGSKAEVKTGLDAAFCLRGVNLFGELSFDWTAKRIKALAGTRFRTGEYMDMSLQLRGFQADQYGLAAGGEFSRGRHKGSWTIDATYHPYSKDQSDPYSLQLKSYLLWEILLMKNMHLKIRVSERIRTWGLPYRTDLRADLKYDFSPFGVLLRLNVLKCDAVGFLTYAEGSYSSSGVSLHLRQGLFIIDDWDDRIYVYERDAPGSFNAPAMYGRGLWTSAVAGMKFSDRIRLYLRAAYTCYPFMDMEKKKPGKAELKLQLQCRF